MSTLPLFEAPSPQEHHAAFENWLAAQQANGTLRQSSSAEVYRDMWGSFTQWCLSQSPVVRLDALHMRDLRAFQDARFGVKNADQSLTSRHALRLLRLIDRVLHHHADRTDALPNPAAAHWTAAQPAVRFAEAADADPLPDHLSIAEAKHLIAFVSK